MMMKPLQTYAKKEFLFDGVLLAMERFFVYGENCFEICDGSSFHRHNQN
jgi:hypothetical protein